MTDSYNVSCTCGGVTMRLEGEPRVRGFCHCEDCRELLDVPYHSVTAWEPHQFAVVSGEELVVEYQHPEKRMKRVYCSGCGETLYNTNAMDWRVVSQLLIRRNLGGELPSELQSKSHFFYGRRIVDIDDGLPKRD